MGCGIETEAVVPMGALVLLQLEPEGSPIDIDVGEVRSRQPRRIGVASLGSRRPIRREFARSIQRLLAARPT